MLTAGELQQQYSNLYGRDNCVGEIGASCNTGKL